METIRKGYKHTDIGIIPEDWEDKKIHKIGDTYTGLTGKNAADFKCGDARYIPFLNILTNPQIDIRNIESVSVKPNETQNRVKNGDLFFNTSSETPEEVGLCSVLEQEIPNLYLNSFCFGFRLFNQKEVYGLFLSYFFRSKQGRYLMTQLAQGATRYNLAKTNFMQAIIPLPPPAEQRAIAEVLSDIDSLIEVLDKKIAKKRAIKDGAMQQLLTAKKRLPGFSDPWVEKKLGDISNIKTGSRNGEECITDGLYPFFVRSQIVQRINSFSFDGEAILVPGEGGIGEIFHYVNGRFDYHQRVYKISNFEDNIDSKFVFYYLKRYFGNYALQQTVKATVDSLRLPTFTDFEIRLPKSKKEQQAIAQILTDMDDEIELLKQQRSKYTALKQGAMQQLLTGQIRLVADRQIRQTDKSPKQANVHFKRSVWAAEIADRLCNEPTFGHVKMEKMIFLTEHLCGVDIGSNYHRDAAGPYDNRAIRSIDSQLRKQNWFEAKREERAIRYIPLSKRGGHKDYFNKYFSDVQADFDKVINTFRNWNTERCEIVATLYSAWKDIASAQKSYSDEDIINEVLNNWHESKKRIPIERWQLALKWMREKRFEPKL